MGTRHPCWRAVTHYREQEAVSTPVHADILSLPRDIADQPTASRMDTDTEFYQFLTPAVFCTGVLNVRAEVGSGAHLQQRL